MLSHPRVRHHRMRLIESSTSVGSRLTNLSRGWYDVTNTSRGGSRDWDVTSYQSPETEICLSGFNTGTWLFFSYLVEICILKRNMYADNVLFNVTETLWRRGKRCALRCDVIVTDVNEQKWVRDSLYQTGTRGTRQAREVPDRKSRNPSFGWIFLSQVRENISPDVQSLGIDLSPLPELQ